MSNMQSQFNQRFHMKDISIDYINMIKNEYNGNELATLNATLRSPSKMSGIAFEEEFPEVKRFLSMGRGENIEKVRPRNVSFQFLYDSQKRASESPSKRLSKHPLFQ